MKCTHCGKKIADGSAICPYCGESTGSDIFDGNESVQDYGFSDGGFDPEPAYPARKPRRNQNGKTIPLLAALCAVPAVILAVMLVFFSRGPKEAPLPAVAASTGHSERIDEGRGILLNELLIIPAEGTDRSRLEEILEPMGGAPVAYLPEINQYQVKFNTTGRDELDRYRTALLDSGAIVRADYNLVLSVLRPGETGEDLILPAGKNETIGILGDWIPNRSGTLKTVYLPSPEFGTEEQMFSATEQDPDFFSESWKTTLQQLAEGRTVTVANAFAYTSGDNGSLHAVCTSAALRSQLAAIVKTGANRIAVPLSGPSMNNDAMLEQETAQMDLLMEELEAGHPGFMILISQKGSDWLPKVLSASEKARDHTLRVCGNEGTQQINAINLTETDLPVFSSTYLLAEADFCVSCGDSGNAAILATAYAAGSETLKTDGTRQDALSDLQAKASEIAAGPDGTVRPVLSANLSGAGIRNPEELEAVTVQILDEITGLPVPDASISSVQGSRTARVDPEGRALLVTENRHGTVSIKAEGYADKENLTIGENPMTVFLAPARQAETGVIRYSVQDLDGQAPDGLTVMLKNPENGEVRLSKKTGYSDQISIYPGLYDMVITAYNRTSVTLHDVSVTAGGETVIPTVSLSVPSDIPGTAAGMIKDAMTGDPLSGVTLSFHEGIGASEGDRQAVKISNQNNGQYKVELPAGEYTMIVSKEGYKTASMTVHSRGEAVIGDQNCTITPKVPEGQIRIVLEWGRTPADLDSHLFNPSQRIHVFFPADKKTAKRNGRKVVNLDVDDRDGWGPETTTILEQMTGKYIFLIHNYTDRDSYNSRTMASSGAKVTVYIGDLAPQVFEVPNQAGIVWEVFTLENGILTPSGRILNEREWNDLQNKPYSSN